MQISEPVIAGIDSFRLRVRPDGQLVSARVSEVEAPPARKRKNGFDNPATSGLHLLLTRFKVVAVKYRERRTCVICIPRNASGFTIAAWVGKSSVTGSVIVEVPVERRSIKVFGR